MSVCESAGRAERCGSGATRDELRMAGRYRSGLPNARRGVSADSLSARVAFECRAELGSAEDGALSAWSGAFAEACRHGRAKETGVPSVGRRGTSGAARDAWIDDRAHRKYIHTDVRAILPSIHVPTLVFRRADAEDDTPTQSRSTSLLSGFRRPSWSSFPAAIDPPGSATRNRCYA